MRQWDTFCLTYLFWFQLHENVWIHLTIHLRNLTAWDVTTCPESFTRLFCKSIKKEEGGRKKKSKEKNKQTFYLGCYHPDFNEQRWCETLDVLNHVSEHLQQRLCFLSFCFLVSSSPCWSNLFFSSWKLYTFRLCVKDGIMTTCTLTVTCLWLLNLHWTSPISHLIHKYIAHNSVTLLWADKRTL